MWHHQLGRGKRQRILARHVLPYSSRNSLTSLQPGIQVADVDNGRTYQLATILIDQDVPSLERELLQRQLTEELERVRANIVDRLGRGGN